MRSFADAHSATARQRAQAMIQTLFSRFHRWMPQPGNEEVLHAWTNEDSNWHGSSLDLARGLEVTEMPGSTHGVGDRPRAPAVFLDTPPAVHGARR